MRSDFLEKNVFYFNFSHIYLFVYKFRNDLNRTQSKEKAYCFLLTLTFRCWPASWKLFLHMQLVFFWPQLKHLRERAEALQDGLTSSEIQQTTVRSLHLCLCPACSSCSPLTKLVCAVCVCTFFFLYFWIQFLSSLCPCHFRNDIYRGTLFRPLQFFCKVRYVNWWALHLWSSCMCRTQAANSIIHSNHKPNCVCPNPSQNQTKLG